MTSPTGERRMGGVSEHVRRLRDIRAYYESIDRSGSVRVAALDAAIAALSASPAEGAQSEDAARYRWLRDPANSEAVSDLIGIYNYGDEVLLMVGAELDAAIDHARRAEGVRDGE